jgi:hypothetical protein
MKKEDPYLERYFTEVLNKDGFFGPWSEILPESKEILEEDAGFKKWKLKESIKALKRGVKKAIGL